MVGDAGPAKWQYSEHTRAKHELLTRFKGRTLTYTQVTDECSFDGNELPESDYRKALQALEAENAVGIERVESKTTGLRGRDRIIFPKSSRPPDFLVLPPHCLKKNATPASRHLPVSRWDSRFLDDSFLVPCGDNGVSEAIGRRTGYRLAEVATAIGI